MAAFASAYDVIVLGSGASGLVAALHAARAGLSVLVCEKSPLIGGTSAMSAGGIWVAGNDLAAKAGLPDSTDEALSYALAVAPKGWAHRAPQIKAMLEAGPKMLRLLQEATPLRLRLTHEPDPYLSVAGSRARGRMMSVLPISRLAAGRDAFRVRGSTLPEVFTYHEVLETDLYHKPLSTTLRLLPRLVGRALRLQAGKGTALMIGLTRGCKDAGCQITTRARAVRLLSDAAGHVTGAEIAHRGRSHQITARHGVILATGGFEWDADMMRAHLGDPLQFIGPPASNTGDGQKMAQEIGAKLGAMDQATFTAAIPKFYHGRIHGMPVPYHAEENAIVVNYLGQRFEDELVVNMGEALDRRDQNGARLNQPAYVISDASYLPKVPLVRFLAWQVPGWLTKAPDLRSLAAKIGVDADQLEATVARYNTFAATGVDADFGRGKTKGHQAADKRKRAGLAPIVKAPFVAVKFNRSVMSTKGGAECDARGRVLRADNTVISGLYAAGSAMANPIGTRGIGAGTTLGPFMSWGYLCADDIIARAKTGG